MVNALKQSLCYTHLSDVLKLLTPEERYGFIYYLNPNDLQKIVSKGSPFYKEFYEIYNLLPSDNNNCARTQFVNKLRGNDFVFYKKIILQPADLLTLFTHVNTWHHQSTILVSLGEDFLLLLLNNKDTFKAVKDLVPLPCHKDFDDLVIHSKLNWGAECGEVIVPCSVISLPPAFPLIEEVNVINNRLEKVNATLNKRP